MNAGTDYQQKYAHLNSLMGKLAVANPKTVGAFGRLHQEALADGSLDRKTKELMALAISIVTHCEGCVAFHTHDALKAGASHGEIWETIGVAIMMGGGPAAVYGCEALQALEQFES